MGRNLRTSVSQVSNHVISNWSYRKESPKKIKVRTPKEAEERLCITIITRQVRSQIFQRLGFSQKSLREKGRIVTHAT